jgi:hypothetical protein
MYTKINDIIQLFDLLPAPGVDLAAAIGPPCARPHAGGRATPASRRPAPGGVPLTQGPRRF